MKLTPYQRIVRSLESDERWHREVAIGRRVGFYRLRGDIGTGNFSQVKVALHCLTREKVAVKIIDKSKLDPKTRKMLIREIRSMEAVRHPNIVTIFEVIETLSKIYLVMEFAADGELYQYVNREGRLEESEAKALFAQIVAAIEHMHSHNIIHRDIKAENILLSDRKTVKVADFGFSTHIEAKEQLLSTFCGSPPYAAPELFHDDSYVGPYVDYWALGVLLYFMVTSLMPFRAITISALKKLIIECDYQIPEYISDQCVSVINGLLQIDCYQRWDLKRLKDSEWLRGQAFADSLPLYRLKTFSNTNSDQQNNNDCLSADEYDLECLAYKQLNDLGIDHNIIARNADKGSRSSVVGTFNIIVNKITKTKLKSNESLEKDRNDNYLDNESDVQSTTANATTDGKPSKSITKSIKSIKNIFADHKTVRPRLEQSTSLPNDNHTKDPNKPKNRKFTKSKTCCLL